GKSGGARGVVAASACPQTWPSEWTLDRSRRRALSCRTINAYPKIFGNNRHSGFRPEVGREDGMTGQAPPNITPGENPPWQDRKLTPAQRADALIPLMTLEEKVAQLVGVWAGADPSGDGVAPRQSDM